MSVQDFKKNETPFCTVNNDNLRNILFEKIRYHDDEKKGFKWSFLGETGFNITMETSLKR